MATPQTLWSALSSMGSTRVKRLTLTIDAMAPEPGSLVYLVAEKLASGSQELNPSVFSAVDACTHLQVARLYMTWTFASAVDFLSFACEVFPS